MKIVLAQLRKDYLSSRALFWVWVVCVAFDCLCFIGRIPLPHTLQSHAWTVLMLSIMGLMAGAVGSFVIQSLLFLALIVRVIQADSLVEPDAFWRTRPIPRGVLLAEKLLFVAVLLSGTLLAGAAIHFQTGEANRWLLLLHTLVFVSGLVAFAAVTANFAQFILTFVVIALGAQVLAGIVIRAWGKIESTPTREHAHLLADPGYSSISFLYLTAFLSVIVWQYLTLKTNVSRVILCLTFFLATLWQVR